MLAAALALGAVRLALPIVRGDDPGTPMTALKALPPELLKQPVLNDYAFGGYMISAGVAPFIDGRQEVYRDAFIDRYHKVIAPDPKALDAVLADYRIGWTIFMPSQPVVAIMDLKPGWRRAYTDKYAVVHVRTAAP